jgi:hypothetical protein
MRTEPAYSQSVNRKSPSEVTDVAAKRKLHLVEENREEKEKWVFHVTFMRHANTLMDDLGLPLEFEKQQGKVALKMDVKRPFSVESYEGLDMEKMAGDPHYRTETRRVDSTGAYVLTERSHDKHGHESVTVRPDGYGAYPEEGDLRAAMMHDFALGRKWHTQLRSFSDAALIMHNYDPCPKQWLWRAMEALCASSPDLEPEEAANMTTMVIKDLVRAHRERA